MWFPDNWKVNIEEGSLSASSLDDDAGVELMSLEGAGDLAAASESCRARLAAKVRQFEESEARRDVSLNGMSGFAFGGQGVRGGVKKTVRVVVLKAPKQYVMLLWFADRATANRFNATYDRIAGSIKPVRQVATMK